MLNQNVFKNKQRFLFRLFNFCLASVMVANVMLGGVASKRAILYADETGSVPTEAAAAPTTGAVGKNTPMPNATGHVGTWTEFKDVKNKEEAVELATLTDVPQDIPRDYRGDSGQNRMTFMIQELSSSEDQGLAEGGNTGSFNLRSRRKFYLVFSVNTVEDDRKIYVNLFDKDTNQIALDEATQQVIQQEMSISVGQEKIPLPGLNAYAKKKGNTSGFNYRLSNIEYPVANSEGESTVVRNLQIRTGQNGNAKNTLVYHALTRSGIEYNQYSGMIPIYQAEQITSYRVKKTKRRPEELLAKYVQTSSLSGTQTFHIAGEAEFDDYELIDTPEQNEGLVSSQYPVGAPLLTWYARKSLQAKVQLIVKADGTTRYMHFIINPDHPNFIENFKEYVDMPTLQLLALKEEALRFSERLSIIEKTLDAFAEVNTNDSLDEAAKLEKIEEIRSAAVPQLNDVNTDIFFLTFTSDEIEPFSYNKKPDVITGKEDWNYTSKKYNFRNRALDNEGTWYVKDGFHLILDTLNEAGPKANWIPDNARIPAIVGNHNPQTPKVSTGNLKIDNSDVEIGYTRMSMLSPTSKSDNHQYYYYAEKGGVKVFYVNEQGKEIQAPKLVHNHTASDTPYNLATEELDGKKIKEEKIVDQNGDVYYLKAVDTENLKPVSTNENTPDEKREIVKIEEEEGTIEVDKLKELTYVYVKAGHVNVNFVDKEGNKIHEPVKVKENAKPGEAYDTASNKLETIKTEAGKFYKLVPAGEYTVGTVSDQNNLTVSKGQVTGVAPVSGEVVSGETKEVTYVYEELTTAAVVVEYYNTDGEVIKNPVIDEEKISKDMPYDTEVDHRPPTITTDDGTVYFYKVLSEHSDKPKGTVEKDDGLTVVKYVYEKAGSVTVNYVDVNGQPILDKVDALENVAPGTSYDVNDKKHKTIKTANGKVYRLVPAGDYPVGKVSENQNLTSVANGTDTGVDAPTGKVVSGETKAVTYVYEEVTSAVVVEYYNTDGEVIKNPVIDAENVSRGDAYDTEVDRRPSTITADDGTVYYYKAVKDDSEATKGTVEKDDGLTVVKYVYEKAGSVIVHYVDTAGKVIRDTVDDVRNGEAGKPYDTTDKKHQTLPLAIITEDGTQYELVRVDGEENGLIEAGKTIEVTYVYRLVSTPAKSGVITKHVDEEGRFIASTEDGTKPDKSIPNYEYVRTVTDLAGNTTHIYRESSNESGKDRVPNTEAASVSLRLFGVAILGAILSIVLKRRQHKNEL